MGEYFYTQEGAAERFERLKGKKVHIYYQDTKGTNRALIGTISDIDGDMMWLENGAWKGCLDCSNAKICVVSTVEGWGMQNIEIKESL